MKKRRECCKIYTPQTDSAKATGRKNSSEVAVGKRLNEKFMNIYIELDRICSDKFGITSGGITEYITRLNNARFAPGRDDVLPKLVRYKNLRNRFVNEPGAVRKTDDITKDDIRCLIRFCRDVKKKKDPISKYLRKARLYAIKKKAGKIFTALLILALIAAICTIVYLVTKN